MEKLVFKKIVNKAFLLSMIPFMRGYAHIVNNKESYEKLTQVMHGYTTGCVGNYKYESSNICAI